MGVGKADYIVPFAEYYSSARKRQGHRTVYVAVVICGQKPYYVVDTLITEAMETGTEALSKELLECEIKSDGKIAIYDIHFNTGSASIQADSQTALRTMADCIKASPGMNFTIVGYTDDTGPLEANLAASLLGQNKSISAALPEIHLT